MGEPSVASQKPFFALPLAILEPKEHAHAPLARERGENGPDVLAYTPDPARCEHLRE